MTNMKNLNIGDKKHLPFYGAHVFKIIGALNRKCPMLRILLCVFD